MPAPRVQRQIDRLLDEAEHAFEERQWQRLRQLAADVLSLEVDNEDARLFAESARRNLSLAQPALPAPGAGDGSGETEGGDARGARWTQGIEILDRAVDLFSQPHARGYLRDLVAKRLGGDGGVGSSIDAVAAKVLAERLDLTALAAPVGTVTILFSDIEDSAQLNDRLGDQRWMDVLHEHNDLVRREVSVHGGFEVKNRGDGFMLAFGSASAAVHTAIGVQRAIGERNRAAETPVHVRIGLHTGESVREAADFYGNHVNLAARIADQARADEILVSSLLRELTEPSGAFRFGESRTVELKGIGGQTAHPVEWRPD